MELSFIDISGPLSIYQGQNIFAINTIALIATDAFMKKNKKVYPSDGLEIQFLDIIFNVAIFPIVALGMIIFFPFVLIGFNVYHGFNVLKNGKA